MIYYGYDCILTCNLEKFHGHVLQVKIKFKLKFFQPTLILNFLCLQGLIHKSLLGLDKEKWEST